MEVKEDVAALAEDMVKERYMRIWSSPNPHLNIASVSANEDEDSSVSGSVDDSVDVKERDIKTLIEQVWAETALLYNESHRHYHTFQHIKELLSLADQYAAMITDRLAVELAIIFHDVIYNPKSGTNEEDSAVFFEQRLSQLLSPEMSKKVSRYIIDTKKHAVADSGDEDLKLFIDFDLFVLGSDQDTYAVYARQIRQEYLHVDKELYCRERPKFLRVLAGEGSSAAGEWLSGAREGSGSSSTSGLYASGVFKERDGAARANLLWECGILESGSLIEAASGFYVLKRRYCSMY